ncbi:hypothetical protein BCR34DRAFT_365779 [Clohesyomyces aquaticus]|uniref:Secreted protein n=1 Tax=Clohesyomyces aquaticus TaxID=1231657 RepID=A0A1Y1ZHM6_9PLEO|nr:hypothetical protein BCR34DRAFT_365779 [Clohesyomyces aquaticus]
MLGRALLLTLMRNPILVAVYFACPRLPASLALNWLGGEGGSASSQARCRTPMVRRRVSPADPRNVVHMGVGGREG